MNPLPLGVGRLSGAYMSIDPIVDMISTAVTSLGNLTITLVSARKENMLDMEKYYGHE